MAVSSMVRAWLSASITSGLPCMLRGLQGGGRTTGPPARTTTPQDRNPAGHGQLGLSEAGKAPTTTIRPPGPGSVVAASSKPARSQRQVANFRHRLSRGGLHDQDQYG